MLCFSYSSSVNCNFRFIATTYQELNQPEKAIKLFRDFIDEFETILSKKNPEILMAYYNLSDFLFQNKHYEEAFYKYTVYYKIVLLITEKFSTEQLHDLNTYYYACKVDL